MQKVKEVFLEGLLMRRTMRLTLRRELGSVEVVGSGEHQLLGARVSVVGECQGSM